MRPIRGADDTSLAACDDALDDTGAEYTTGTSVVKRGYVARDAQYSLPAAAGQTQGLAEAADGPDGRSVSFRQRR